MALIFLNPIHRLYGNNLRTLRTLRSLLKTYNPKKTFTHILFGEGVEGKRGGGREALMMIRVLFVLASLINSDGDAHELLSLSPHRSYELDRQHL